MGSVERMACEAMPLALREPLPVLLALEPTMGGWPWDVTLSRAAAAVQILGPFSGPPDSCFLASLEYSVAYQGVEAIVICGEGQGEPDSDATASAARRLATAAQAARDLCPYRTPSIDFVWFDVRARRLWAMSSSDGRFVPLEFAGLGEVVRELLESVKLK